MIVAVIPTRYEPPTLAPLLAVLEADGIPVILKQSVAYDNELHVMWNSGVDEARAMGATEIAILNDDITILPGTMQRMVEGLRSWPNAAVVFPELQAGPPYLPLTAGVVAAEAYGVGHCFMFKAELDLPRFPEEYHLWHGDVIFFERVRALGYDLVHVTGLVVGHIGSFSILQVRDEMECIEDQLLRIRDVGWSRVWVGRSQSKRTFLRAINRLGIQLPKE